MKQELTNAFGNVYLTIEVDLLNHWVHTNWIGYLTEEITKAGTEAYTEAVKESGFNCVLNDSRQVLGRWEHSVEWALHEWVPQAVYAGTWMGSPPIRDAKQRADILCVLGGR